MLNSSCNSASSLQPQFKFSTQSTKKKSNFKGFLNLLLCSLPPWMCQKLACYGRAKRLSSTSRLCSSAVKGHWRKELHEHTLIRLHWWADPSGLISLYHLSLLALIIFNGRWSICLTALQAVAAAVPVSMMRGSAPLARHWLGRLFKGSDWVPHVSIHAESNVPHSLCQMCVLCRLYFCDFKQDRNYHGHQ